MTATLATLPPDHPLARFEPLRPRFACSCSRERVRGMLLGLRGTLSSLAQVLIGFIGLLPRHRSRLICLQPGPAAGRRHRLGQGQPRSGLRGAGRGADRGDDLGTGLDDRTVTAAVTESEILFENSQFVKGSITS